MSRTRPEDWSAVGEAWLHRRPQRLWRAHSDAINAGLLRRWVPAGRGGRVLKTDAFDEAFGDGLARPLRERFETLCEVDVAVPVLRAARRGNPGLRGVGGDVRALPLGDATMDAVVSLSTLDHFDEVDHIDAALAEFARVLRPGGRLIVTLDNPVNPAVALRNRLPGSWLRRIGLVPYYVGETIGPDRLARTLARHAFEVIEMDAIQHAPRAPAVALAWLLSRGGGKAAERAFLRAATGFERLRGWPTRFRTGYFVAALAVRS